MFHLCYACSWRNFMRNSQDPFVYVTKENWKEYSEEVCSSPYSEYVLATHHIVAKMGTILATAKDFDDLKNQLTLLYAERKDFVEFAEKFENRPRNR